MVSQTYGSNIIYSLKKTQLALSVIDTSKHCLLETPQDALAVSYTLFCKINSELLF